MGSIESLLYEIFKDAYLEGRKAGLEGLYTEPQLVFDCYVVDEKFLTKMSVLSCVPEQSQGTDSSGKVKTI
ncbi:hypothetical protein Q3O60_05175 [Alkalimonas collagenimarina]|uniref:Uncharacterized protein n=1 Tax=Alkalimonas collagenimarina TaxID=400390 RepID=A0ABT9GY05_9GAMM|nr:hypothetical protein [Alkalimonas collagenimarina]MDP4535570.1 hypothetical protein [Alkalimonas collagenimarina]